MGKKGKNGNSVMHDQFVRWFKIFHFYRNRRQIRRDKKKLSK